MITLFLTLFSIAASIGADDLASKIQRDKARVKHLTTDDILRTVNSVLDRANRYEGNKSKQLSNQLTILNNKLSALPFNQNVGIVKEKIQQARRNINNNIVKAQTSLNNVSTEEAKLQQKKSDIQTRAHSLATASDTYKVSKSGQDDLNRLRRDAEQYVNQIEQINKGVETYV